MYEEFKALKIERRGTALWITLDNPPLNSMTDDMHHELSYVFRTASRDPDTRVVVVTGAGDKAFSAGGNIQNMKDGLHDHDRWCKGMLEARELVLSILDCHKPVIARINGHAVGVGATIALCSDISIMLDKGKIGDTHVKIGLVAGDGGALLWPLLVGLVNARRYLLSGELITGREAANIGLITEVADAGNLDAAVNRWVDRLGNGASVALYGTKRVLNMHLRQQAQAYMDAHLGLETISQLSHDHAEAVDAFVNKREPKFEGR